MTSSTIAKAIWGGWRRRHKRERWVKRAEAEDHGDCLNQLLDAVTYLGGGELLVSDHDPNRADACRCAC